MLRVRRLFYFLLFIFTLSFSVNATEKTLNIPILCYHNFSNVKGSMNLTPERFQEQLQWLQDNGYHVVPLRDVVAYLQGKDVTLPSKPVVITIDDGWKSAYKTMFPIAKKYNAPVTLFIYPQTISEGKNAMTWDELKELQKTGLVTVESHTWDHPNFKIMKRKLSAEAYAGYVKKQMVNSKKVLEEQLGTPVSLLAWPFGIYDAYLEQAASEAGYDMAFTIDARPANKSFRAMAVPRFMIIQGQTMKTFAGIVSR